MEPDEKETTLRMIKFMMQQYLDLYNRVDRENIDGDEAFRIHRALYRLRNDLSRRLCSLKIGNQLISKLNDTTEKP